MVNLLNENDNESSNFATKKWYVTNDQNNRKCEEGNEMIQALNLRQKSINQVFMIIQIHIIL